MKGVGIFLGLTIRYNMGFMAIVLWNLNNISIYWEGIDGSFGYTFQMFSNNVSLGTWHEKKYQQRILWNAFWWYTVSWDSIAWHDMAFYSAIFYGMVFFIAFVSVRSI